jgi:putative phage-type endonuclease
MNIQAIDNSRCEIIADNRELTEEEWLKLRRTGIGGSEAGAIMKVSPYDSPLTVWMKKTNRVETEPPNENMKWGKILEPIIREKIAEYMMDNLELETAVFESPFMYRSKLHPFMIGDIDGLLILDSELNGIEIKAVDSYQRDKWKEGEMPDFYYAQVQHYLSVTGLPVWWVFVLIGKALEHCYVPRNEDFIQEMIGAEKAFWNMVINDIPPAPSGIESESTVLLKAFSEEEDDQISLPELEPDMEEYLNIKGKIKELERKKESLANEFRLHAGEKKRIIAGEHSATWSRFKRHNFLTEPFKKAHPDLYEQYSEEKPSQRLSVK